MSFYRKDLVSESHRKDVRSALEGLVSLSPPIAERVVEAWSIMWSSGEFPDLRGVPVSPSVAYSLIDHTNDVVRIGRGLVAGGGNLIPPGFDPELLDEILFVHDIDKLVLFSPKREGVEHSTLSTQMAHGVVAGLVLHDLGFRDEVVSVVTTHATNAPFHVASIYGLLMNYADMTAIDLALQRVGGKPFYTLTGGTPTAG